MSKFIGNKAVLREKFIASKLHTLQKQKTQINKLISHLKKQEKEEQNKTKATRGRK